MQQNEAMSIAERSAVGVWRSRTTFVLALTAAAIGLGNLWRFSYLVGENGGAPFVLVYVLTLILVAVPIMIAEVVIGSHGRASAMNSLVLACRRSNVPRAWIVLGWLSGLTALMILSYYSVVAGWSLAYVQKMDSGVFADSSAILVGEYFQNFLADPQPLVYWQSVFLFLTFLVSGLGVHRGLAVLAWIAVPVLIVILALLVMYNLQYGDMVRAQAFLFSYNEFDFTAESALIAMGQAFYTLSVGVGVGLAFGAYSPDRIPIARTVMAVALFDTTVALAAGLAIFPVVFAANLEPSMGPGLMFVSLPYVFGNMPEGEMLGMLFFLMVSFVAMGSAVALAEGPVSYLNQRMRLKRPLAAALVGFSVWMLGLGCTLSFNLWQDVDLWRGMNLFQLLDFISADILLPLVCLLTALFAGYALKREVLRVEMYRESRLFFFLWRASLRYIAPPAIVLVMLIALLGPV